jgi:hypothetical protein
MSIIRIGLLKISLPGSSIGIVTRLRAGRSDVRLPVKKRDFSHRQQFQTEVGAHSASYSVGIGVLSRDKSGRGVKLTSCVHLVQNQWLYSSTSPVCLHGV